MSQNLTEEYLITQVFFSCRQHSYLRLAFHLDFCVLDMVRMELYGHFATHAHSRGITRIFTVDTCDVVFQVH
jgi:hypothetical protein